eukprot:1195514-Prorocentrum_minimum.AAC.2
MLVSVNNNQVDTSAIRECVPAGQAGDDAVAGGAAVGAAADGGAVRAGALLAPHRPHAPDPRPHGAPRLPARWRPQVRPPQGPAAGAKRHPSDDR